MGRHDLTDEQYALIEPILPTNTGKTGHRWNPHRPIINGILWRLHTGAPWPDIPERYGNWKTIYDRYVWWRRNGTWNRILVALQVTLDAQASLTGTNEHWMGLSSVPTSDAAGAPRDDSWDGDDEPPDHALGRSVGGFTTKILLVSDGNGVPLDALLTPGQTHFLHAG